MSELYLLRHGQASFASADYDRLSPLGEQQARTTGAFLSERNVRFDRVLVGPRRRHAQTGRLVVDAMATGANVETDVALDEIADGNHLLSAARARLRGTNGVDGVQTRAEELVEYANLIKLWASGDVEIDGCVSAVEFLARARNWVAGLQVDARASQRVLAVTSAGTIAALVCIVLDLPPQRCGDLMLLQGNAALSEIVFRDDKLGLRCFNSRAHLPPAVQSAI